VDEPGQHAHHGNEEDDLKDPPGDEEEAGDSHGLVWLVVLMVSQ